MTGDLLSIILSLDRKFRKWEMREDKFENSIAKNQVYAIFHMRDTWNNVLHKFIRLYMEMPCWRPFEANKNIVGKNRQKHVFEFFYKRVNLCLRSSSNVETA